MDFRWRIRRSRSQFNIRRRGCATESYSQFGNRSALEWVIDQYRVTRDEKGNIASNPNCLDDEEYIVRLIGQVITVSLETLKVVASLPEIGTAAQLIPGSPG